MTCRRRRRLRWASAWYERAKSFSGGFAPSARPGEDPTHNYFCEGKDEQMEKDVREAAPAAAQNGHAMADGAKCPVAHGARGRRNRDWWPEGLDISVLHRNSPLSDPMGAEFDY